jgi:hypothetical protein
VGRHGAWGGQRQRTYLPVYLFWRFSVFGDFRVQLKNSHICVMFFELVMHKNGQNAIKTIAGGKRQDFFPSQLFWQKVFSTWTSL